MSADLPIAVIGAGPVGLAAASHLVHRGLIPLVFERGPIAGHALSQWSHVRVFSPWAFNTDPVARDLLMETGWREPKGNLYPTGGEILRDYLHPLANHSRIAPHVVYGATVLSIVREGFAKIVTAGREDALFLIRWRDSTGQQHRSRARAVIDASGTWFSPNPMGLDGEFVQGEMEASGRIDYWIPNVLADARSRYAGSRILVVGGGHSAMNVVLDLLKLRHESPNTWISWALRTDRIEKLVGLGEKDRWPARGSLGLAAKAAIDAGKIEVLAPYRADQITQSESGLVVSGRVGNRPHTIEVDRIVVATGFRPDIEMLREIRVELDPVLETSPILAPMVDPNAHSCGSVPPHGEAALSHPETGFYIVGSKSYGRAPTFLLAIGYEQVRSVVAHLAGDFDAARRVEIKLPEGPICSTETPAPRAGCGASCNE